MQQWEYHATIFTADAKAWQKELREAGIDPSKLLKFSPKAMAPELDALGAEGWELVHMQPVLIGEDADITAFITVGPAGRYWTHSYFGVFKRPKQN